jgi:hypothetical protein
MMVSAKPLLALFIVAGALVGLSGCGEALAQPKTVVLCSFEKVPDPSVSRQVYDLVEALKKPDLPVDDYGWSTSGYVAMEPFPKYATQGKFTAQAKFTVPGDFKKVKPKTWEAGMTLSTDTPTKLAVTDWSPYKLLVVDVYNAEDKEYQAFLRFSDSAGNLTETASLIRAKNKSYMLIEVTRLAEARLNTKDLKALTIYLNTVDQPAAPVLYFDNVRLTSAPLPKLR